MASIGWALLLFLAQLHTLIATSSAHHADGGNLTRTPVPILCHPDHAKALLQLKKSFFSGSITRLSSWQAGTDCCRWEGVGCDASSGNVTVLDLNNRGLSSYGLDPSVFSLTSLRRLDLSMNDFSGNRYWLPDNTATTRFERFALLTHLNLSNSRLFGQIPIGISKLINLLSLDLSTRFDSDYQNNIAASNSFEPSNYLWESNFDTLVANLSNLRELYLDEVDLSRSGEEWCVSLATFVPRLQVLSLANCNLRGPIHEALSKLHSLTVVNLEGNNDITASPFPELFMEFLNLTVLQLSVINLKGWFPTKSFQSKNLKVLDLSYNQNLSGHLPNFSNASSLETLRLDGTNFSYAKPTSSSSNLKLLKELSIDGNLVSADFLSSLGGLGSLRQLDLGFDSVSDLGSIFSWIGDHMNLMSLALFGCNFSMTTPSMLSNFKTLRTLGMYGCNVPRSILSAIGNLMVDLQTLEMDDCTTYGSMPSSIGNLTNLRNMNILNSGFSGSIPYEVGQLNKLTRLDLTSCNFSGRIPSSIVNLTHLTTLDLSDNSLIGEIPSSIFKLPVLCDLCLYLNQLSGPIREFDKAPASQLESLDLSRNDFSGPIPKAFFQLTRLKSLDISSNNLIGLVDLTSFWRLSELTSLHLSNNKLHVIDAEGSSILLTDWSGPKSIGLASCNITRFPRSLMRIKHLSYLDLSSNKISGDIPNWIWETWSSSLNTLSLSHNMLTGMRLTSYVLPFTAPLFCLDLSFNRLSGLIPMPNSSAEVLDYSSNRFSSVLPNLAFYLSYTKHLSMSRNSINGRIPLSVCNSTMEFLDLSHNNFSGPIPSCLVENAQLGVLNLRENHFEGTLPSNITNECSLYMIDLHGNKIEGQLPRGLSNCQFLEVLDLGSNQIVDTFPSWLKVLPGLSLVILRSNRFYGTIGDIVGDIKSEECFPSLQIIDLASNNFSGHLRPEWFERLKSMMAKFNSSGENLYDRNISNPEEFYQDSIEITYKGSSIPFEKILTTLTVIDFSNNRLEGTIPESIGRLVSLRLLNMSHNAFTGNIPAQLGGMTELESLDLSCNQLSGDIPEELTNLTFLGVLNFSNNHLVGKIPQSHQFFTFNSSSFEGNAGLCGPPLSEVPCGASPYTPSVEHVNKSSHHVDVILFLFVGLGFGVGFAAAIVVKWGPIGRWFIATAARGEILFPNASIIGRGLYVTRC